jgi:predicted nuclease with TOPRIM domain
MSTGSTINNLQKALDCAGKCDCCEKLQSQINALRNDLNRLRQEKSNNNLGQITKRIDKLENFCSGVEQYLNAVTPLISAVRNFLG